MTVADRQRCELEIELLKLALTGSATSELPTHIPNTIVNNAVSIAKIAADTILEAYRILEPEVYPSEETTLET